MAGGGELIDRFEAGGRADPVAAVLVDGGFVVVWERGGALAQARFGTDGRPGTAGPVPGVARGSGAAQDPRVVATAHGGWALAWTSVGDSPGIDCAAFDPHGRCRGERAVRASAGSRGGRLSAPVLTATPAGGFVVTWGLESEDESTLAILQRPFDGGGRPLGPERIVNAATVGWQFEVDVAALADGGWVVVWEAFEGEHAHPGIFHQRYGPDGAAESPSESAVSPGTQAWQFDPFAVALANGGYLVCWEALDPDNVSLGLFQRLYGAQGGMRGGAEVRVNGTPLGWRFKPVVTPLPDGGWETTWVSEARSRATWGVFQRRFDAHGQPQHLSGHLSAAAPDIQKPPSCIALDDGNLVMTWTAHDGESAVAIRQRLYDGANLHRGPIESVVAESAVGAAGQPATVALPGGRWVTVWAESGPGGDRRILHRLFSAGGLHGRAAGGRSRLGAAAPEAAADIHLPGGAVRAGPPPLAVWPGPERR